MFAEELKEDPCLTSSTEQDKEPGLLPALKPRLSIKPPHKVRADINTRSDFVPKVCLQDTFLDQQKHVKTST